MARCKQSSTRPPNCNFLCLILVTERKKYIYIQRIYFCIYFFCIPRHFIFSKKYLKGFLPSPLIPSYLSLFLERSVVSKDRRRSNCRRWKKISIFLLARSTVSLQLKFSSCLNYSRIIFIQVQMQIYFYPLFSSIFYRFHPYIYYRKFITIPLSILGTLN